MTISFKEFIPKYLDGTIMEDAAWRAYDIQGIATPAKARDALKFLGYRDISLFGFDKCARDYGLRGTQQAQQLLGLWWAWRRIALGHAKRQPLREVISDGD